MSAKDTMFRYVIPDDIANFADIYKRVDKPLWFDIHSTSGDYYLLLRVQFDRSLLGRK